MWLCIKIIFCVIFIAACEKTKSEAEQNDQSELRTLLIRNGMKIYKRKYVDDLMVEIVSR